MLSPINNRPMSARPHRRRRKLSRGYGNENDFMMTPDLIFSSGSSTRSSNNGIDRVEPFHIHSGSVSARGAAPKVLPYTGMQQMRSFNVDAHGRVVDCGFRYGGSCSRPLTPRNPKSRRSTCPEIWLSTDDDRPNTTRFALRIYGAETVGKTALIRQMVSHADATGGPLESVISSSDGKTILSRPIKFMMNDTEVELDLIQGSALGQDMFDEVPTIFLVMYSVDCRESFTWAAQTLFRLYNRKSATRPSILLIANKVDLQRKRKVSTIEGKMLAKIYKSDFVEISALLTMNMEILWKDVVRKLQQYILEKEKLAEREERRRNRRGTLNRIVERGRKFAKSCEELVARIAAI
uniref:Ras-related and estrogen-regulated growth inhibitor n=1 Tax=Panagrellus redivivus TaxID=6233 RepID=A0A7E4V5A1_PANRE